MSDAKNASGPGIVVFGFHNDAVSNETAVTLADPMEYTIDPRGDNIFTLVLYLVIGPN